MRAFHPRRYAGWDVPLFAIFEEGSGSAEEIASALEVGRDDLTARGGEVRERDVGQGGKDEVDRLHLEVGVEDGAKPAEQLLIEVAQIIEHVGHRRVAEYEAKITMASGARLAMALRDHRKARVETLERFFEDHLLGLSELVHEMKAIGQLRDEIDDGLLGILPEVIAFSA